MVFSSWFYTSLVAGEPVDAAVGRARNAVFAPGQPHAEWCTPVLFMRSPDGILFDRTYVTPEALASAPATAAPDAPNAAAAPAAVATPASAAATAAPTAASTSASPIASTAAPQEDRPFSVALAVTCEQLGSWNRRLKKELTAKGMKVTELTCDSTEEMTQQIEELAASADLFVHVLGAQRGEQMDDAADKRSFPMEQYRLANRVARSQLVVAPAALNQLAGTDADYARFLEEIETVRRESDRLEVMALDLESFTTEVVRKLERQKAASSIARVSSVYLDFHLRDAEAAVRMQIALASRGVAVTSMPTSDAPPTQVIAQYQKNLQRVPLVLFLIGNGGEQWVKERLGAALKVVVGCDPEPRLAAVRLPGSPPFTSRYATVVGDGVSMPDDATIDALLQDAQGMGA